MKWLLWKDYRHNRPVVIATLLFLLGPHLMALCNTLILKGNAPNGTPLWKTNFIASSMCSLFVCQLVAAVLGGNAIAGERVDRSAEFLASLPITRRRILASKIVIALAIIAVIWLTNAPALVCLMASKRMELCQLAQLFAVVAITAATFFSVAWLLSSYINSPTFAAAGGLLTPLVFGQTSALTGYLLGFNSDDVTYVYVYCGLCLAAAPVCFAVGTRHYLRRVEP